MLRARAVATLFFGSALLAGAGSEANETLTQENPGEAMVDMKTIARWLAQRFSGADAEAFATQDLRIEAQACGCEDKPQAHFPYRLVLVTTPKGDLVARPHGQEGAVSIVPLAVRYGDRYCKLQSDECYGTFAHPCEFTDFRYGPTLAAFFPACKTDAAK